ncbi:MAG TPA: response regulator [Stellaceae bacterium]|nr:response regulator [Stellaceae bacterium]
MQSDRRVFIVDDDEAVRESLAALLISHGFGVTVFGSGRDFLERCPPEAEACLIADVRMPEMDGLDLQEQAARRFPRLAVVMMTGHGDVPIAVRAMKAGAVDFIEKPFDEATMIATIERALDRPAPPRPPAADHGRLSALTAREHEVLVGLVAGLPNKTIAYDLGISPRTVEVHRARVMEKMQARSLSELVRLALAAGIAPG